jgi:protein-S-isoprenylcysteine O-methyltransferase Ste14
VSDAPDAPTDRADVRVLPPLLFLGSIALGVVLNWWLPLRVAAGGRLRVLVGLAAVGLGVGAIAWTLAWMRRTHQDPDPRKPTPELIVGGPFRHSRNAIYVGTALFQAGVGVALGNAWVVRLLAPTLWLLVRSVVSREEAYLARKFGEPYESYRRSVRRWL